MSKKFITGFAIGMINSLNASNTKDRLKHCIAGVKDGKVFAHDGTNYGEYDGEDAVFITEKDLLLSRVTTVKLKSISDATIKYFEGAVDEVEDAVDEVEGAVDEVEDTDVETVEVSLDEEKVKKLIKKGKFEKAQKLIDEAGGHKKLQKKLDKASK